MATSTASTLRWSSTSWVKNIGGSANESTRVIDGRPIMIVLAQKNAKNSRKLIVMGGMPERAKEFQFLEVGVGYCRHHVLPVVLLKQECQRAVSKHLISKHSNAKIYPRILVGGNESTKMKFQWISSITCGVIPWLTSKQVAYAGSNIKADAMYEIGELFELGIQLSYLLLLLALLGVGSFFVIRQVLVRRELDLSAKELQEQVRSGDANATELFELGAVMLRRKFYPAATKYLIQAVEKWDGDDQDLAQVYNALGVSFVREGKLDKGIAQFETAVKLQPGYVTAWNNLGDAYEQKKELKSALRAFEEVLLFDPNNKVARPRVDSLRERVQMYKGVPIKSKER